MIGLRSSVPIGPYQRRGARKGMFTQCVCVLTDQAPTLADLQRALDGRAALSEVPAADGEHGWALSGPALTLAHREEVNGKVQIDVVDRPWPDAMGSPDREPMLFAAWSMGNFGPTTYPGALERAALHAETPSHASLAERHRAWVRLRISYVLGASSEAPVLPDHYDAIHELAVLSELSVQLASLPGALILFNPNAERLVTGERMKQALARPVLPVDVWASVRRVRPQQVQDWLVCDTVGMGQLDVVDHQLALPREHPTAQHAPALLYGMAAYDAERGGVLSPGDSASDADGRGVSADWAGDASVGPPRPVLAWLPDDVEEVPQELDLSEVPEA